MLKVSKRNPLLYFWNRYAKKAADPPTCAIYLIFCALLPLSFAIPVATTRNPCLSYHPTR